VLFGLIKAMEMKVRRTMDSRLLGRIWASFFQADPGESFSEALAAGRGSVALKESDIVMEKELGLAYYISRQMLRYALGEKGTQPE
jgi:hypothetical protein